MQTSQAGNVLFSSRVRVGQHGQQPPQAVCNSFPSLGRPLALKPVPRRVALADASRDGLFPGQTSFEQQATAAGYLRSAVPAQQQQQYLLHPQPVSGQQQFDSEILWAGYSDLSEQLRKMHAKQVSLMEHINELQGKIKHLQQQPSTTSAWQAATFLLFFLGFINFVGLIANFHMGMFLPWAAKPSGTVLAKQLLGTVLPMTNTLVVVIFCLQAVKAAWVCLRW